MEGVLLWPSGSCEHIKIKSYRDASCGIVFDKILQAQNRMVIITYFCCITFQQTFKTPY